MDIKLTIKDKQEGTAKQTGSFVAIIDDKPIGELDFDITDHVMNAYHTGVRSEYEGQGIAAKLVDALVAYAKEKQLNVMPTCSYIKAKFERSPETYKEIWHKTDQEPSGSSF